MMTTTSNAAGDRLEALLAETERAFIERTLRAHRCHIAATADDLGMSRPGLYKKMKRLGIEPSECMAGEPVVRYEDGLSDGPTLLLDHAAVTTADLGPMIEFYEGIIGLQALPIEPDPIRKGRRRAMLLDRHGHAVLELIEMQEMEHPMIPGRGGLHHLGFRYTREDWLALRERLEEHNYGYRETHGRLFVRDADGMTLEIVTDC
ncbi:MAG: VOC family protein [Bacteroidota bacterium]